MKHKTRVSIIIPTYKRDQTLSETLRRLIDQTYPKKLFEIIVIDDGRSLSTKLLVTKIKKTFRSNIRYFSNNNRGRGAAKNSGIDKSHFELLLLLDDDISVRKDFVQEHVNFYKTYHQITIGKILYGNSKPSTNFEKFISSGTFIKTDSQLSNLLFFHSTANLSIPKAFLKNSRFDELIVKYGYEDLDLGFRLFKKGYKLHYNPKAIGIHLENNNFNKLCQNKYEAGINLSYLITKNPQIKGYINIPPPMILRLRHILKYAVLIIKLIPSNLLPVIFLKLVIGYNFIAGFTEGIKAKDIYKDLVE